MASNQFATKTALLDSSTNSANPKEQDSMLLALPGEIRNYIYDYVVIYSHQRSLGRPPVRLPPTLRNMSYLKSLTQVCAQIRHETLFLYSKRQVQVPFEKLDLYLDTFVYSQPIRRKSEHCAAMVIDFQSRNKFDPGFDLLPLMQLSLGSKDVSIDAVCHWEVRWAYDLRYITASAIRSTKRQLTCLGEAIRSYWLFEGLRHVYVRSVGLNIPGVELVVEDDHAKSWMTIEEGPRRLLKFLGWSSFEDAPYPVTIRR